MRSISHAGVREDANKRKKLVFGISALIIAVGIIAGAGFAYFSDTLGGQGTATAGTLDISGQFSLNQNGQAVVGNNITNLNPGDIITITAGTVTNNGSKSAWIREVFQFTAISDTDNTGAGGAANNVGNLADWLWVCTGGNAGQADLITAFASTARTAGIANSPVTVGATGTTCVPADTTTIFGEKGTYVQPADVISGTAEADGNAVTWTPVAGTTPTIFFDQLANNGAQNGNATFNASIQALQYRNNTTSPNQAQWSTVVTTPFGL